MREYSGIQLCSATIEGSKVLTKVLRFLRTQRQRTLEQQLKIKSELFTVNEHDPILYEE